MTPSLQGEWLYQYACASRLQVPGMAVRVCAAELSRGF